MSTEQPKRRRVRLPRDPEDGHRSMWSGRLANKTKRALLAMSAPEGAPSQAELVDMAVARLYGSEE